MPSTTSAKGQNWRMTERDVGPAEVGGQEGDAEGGDEGADHQRMEAAAPAVAAVDFLFSTVGAQVAPIRASAVVKHRRLPRGAARR